ncbi:amidase family protein [Povalibacter sp.]|uniref:amidase family protein n=1 Tax=Povalibacter sp. TaxID=1962978 RepID=UPI002F40FB25
MSTRSTIRVHRPGGNARRATVNRLAMLLLAASTAVTAGAPATAAEFNLSTATIADINAAFAAGSLNSEKLVSLYLARIEAYDKKGPAVNSVINLNARALEEARALDAERAQRGPRGPMHGMVVLAKDVFDTKDMPTTGGFKPMATSQPERDAFVVERLRDAGAIILGKLNLADWYGSAPNGGSTLLGHCVSPYNPSKYSGGSSSGTGVAMAAWFSTIGLGSDTGGSTVIPSTLNNLVGFSTTHGLISRRGMMWSSPTQDNPGLMGRSVYDGAATLDVVAGFDPADLATQRTFGKLPQVSYTTFVDANGLRGARVGVLREMVRPGEDHAEGRALFERELAAITRAGAIVVDPVLTGLNLPVTQLDASTSSYERAFAVRQYLAGLPADAPIRTLEQMLATGQVSKSTVSSAKIPALERHPEFLARRQHQDVLRAALVELMDRHQLDALVLPYRTTVAASLGTVPTSTAPSSAARRSNANNSLHAYTGLPTIIVPGGFFASDGMPFGMQFLGREFSEPTLIKVASGYEAASHHRRAPASTPPLQGEVFSY